MQRFKKYPSDPNPKVVTNVLSDQLEASEMDTIVQYIGDYHAGGEMEPDDVREKLGEHGNTVTVHFDDTGAVDRIEFGNTTGRRGGRSRLNKKTRRSKGRRRNSVRRKLRKLTSRRR